MLGPFRGTLMVLAAENDQIKALKQNFLTVSIAAYNIRTPFLPIKNKNYFFCLKTGFFPEVVKSMHVFMK